MYAADAERKLVVGGEGMPPPLLARGYKCRIDRFLCRQFLGDAELDYEKIHRFAKNMNAHQLRGTSTWLGGEAITTDRFIDYLFHRGDGAGARQPRALRAGGGPGPRPPSGPPSKVRQAR